MVAVIKLYDHEIGGQPKLHTELRIAAQTMSVRNILRARIEEDVSASRTTAAKSWMIIPSLREQALNGDRGPYGPHTERQTADLETLLDRALDGLAKNRFIMFVDDRQVSDPDEQTSLRSDSTVTFIRLTPLVGG